MEAVGRRLHWPFTGIRGKFTEIMVKRDEARVEHLHRDWLKISQEHHLSPETTTELILEALGELVDYELAVVLSAEGDGALRVFRAKGRLATARLEGYAISLAARPDLARILGEGGPRLLDTGPGHEDTYAEILDFPEGHSCLASPLRIGSRSIGLLTLDHRQCDRFSKEIVAFIAVISRLIALALVQSAAARSLDRRNSELLAERNRLLEGNSEVFRSLAGSSAVWRRVLDAIRLVAATDSPVLLLGETGTGKEEAARAIHRLSPRAPGPFIALNCSALPAALAESELFGHEKGSFTGAQGLRRGRFELADGGTLFLDEIGDLPLEIQPKLLRALQESSFERVGAEAALSVDVRIVAATHLDLEEAVASGRFREDLYYRLAVFPVVLPPLRERGEDSLLIAELFAAELRLRPGWEGLGFSSEALDLIAAREWPGNVRELKNAVERAAILARGGRIGAVELGPGRAGGGGEGGDVSGGAGAAPGGLSGPATMDGRLDGLQRELIEAALAVSRGRIYGPGGAAAALGLKPSTLQSRMRRLGLSGVGKG